MSEKLINIKTLPVIKEIKGEQVNGLYRINKYSAQINDESGLFEKEIKVFRQYAYKSKNLNFTDGNRGIHIINDSTLSDEAYRMNFSDTVNIFVSTGKGLSYAFSSLLQIMENQNNKLNMPAAEFYDYPESSHRGLMIDLARKFHPVKYIFKYIDMCYLYKINRLQLHFTDDQGYTLPSKKFPKLPVKDEHYSENEIEDIVKYADERHITLIPEIDMPGHCAKFIDAYPEIFGVNGVMSADDIVFEALDKLYGELCLMFPNSPYIHIGGDEAAVSNWENCPRSREYMKNNNIKTIEDLYSEFIKKGTEIIFRHGRTPIVWEGFHKSGNVRISKDVIVISWENYYQTAPELLEDGFTLINASWKPLYIVTPAPAWTSEEILSWNRYSWRHWWEKSKAYPDGIDVDPSSKITGGQICAWGDNLTKYESGEKASAEEHQMVRERIPALAEKTWNINSDIQINTYNDIFRLADDIYEKMSS